MVSMVVIILMVFVIFAVAGCAAKGPLTEQEKADEIFSRAVELQGIESHEQAADEFKKFVGKYPNSNDADNAQLGIGDSYRLQGKYEAAIEAYSLVDSNGDVGDVAQLRTGDSYMALGNREEAYNTYQKLVHKYPYLNNEVSKAADERIGALERIKKNTEIIKNGSESQRDNAQYDIGEVYFSVFQDYDSAAREFKKVEDNFPNSELVDDAVWMIGECHWVIAEKSPIAMRGAHLELEAFVRLQHIVDIYPQLNELERFDTDGYPHWPAGKRGDRYELYFAEVRRLLNKFPELKLKKYRDFLPEPYQQALEIWNDLIYKYQNSNAAAQAPQRIAKKLSELGRFHYNISMEDFASIILKKSLEYWPTAEANLLLAYYYADVRVYTRWTSYRTRSFEHLAAAEKLADPHSSLATEIKQAKIWLNYRLRIEALENWTLKARSR